MLVAGSGAVDCWLATILRYAYESINALFHAQLRIDIIERHDEAAPGRIVLRGL
jgi:hypothetical protein